MNKKGFTIFLIPLIIGLLLFLSPTIYKIVNDYNHKGYIETTATFIEAYESGTSDDGAKMYSLIYEYNVDGKQYEYRTDYITTTIPEIGSIIKIKYNPIMPNQSYSNSFSVFSVFQMIGIFFICVSLIALSSNIIWLRDLFLLFFTGGAITAIVINKLYNIAFIIPIIILGILCFASLIDLIIYLKNNKFHPLKDIKKEINKYKKIRIRKKELKQNISQEEIELRLKKKKRIIEGILLFCIPIPLLIFIDIKFGYPNEIIYIVLAIIATIFTFIGFGIIGLTIAGFDPEKSSITVADKRINKKHIKNLNKMTFMQKMKALNIAGLLYYIIVVLIFFLMMYLIIEDPFNFFSIFKNIARAQLFVILGLVCLANFLLVNGRSFSKGEIIKYIILCIIAFIIIYIITIPSYSSNEIITSVNI